MGSVSLGENILHQKLRLRLHMLEGENILLQVLRVDSYSQEERGLTAAVV